MLSYGDTLDRRAIRSALWLFTFLLLSRRLWFTLFCSFSPLVGVHILFTESCKWNFKHFQSRFQLSEPFQTREKREDESAACKRAVRRELKKHRKFFSIFNIIQIEREEKLCSHFEKLSAATFFAEGPWSSTNCFKTTDESTRLVNKQWVQWKRVEVRK